MVKGIRLSAAALLALPAVGAATTGPAVVPCAFSLGAGARALTWTDPSGLKVSAVVRTFPSIALAKRSMSSNTMLANACATIVPLPVKFARIGDQRFVAHFGLRGVVLVRRGRSVAIILRRSFNLPKLVQLGRSAARKITP